MVCLLYNRGYFQAVVDTILSLWAQKKKDGISLLAEKMLASCEKLLRWVS
jgi:hypothetical protein